jgi:hypothetical protein
MTPLDTLPWKGCRNREAKRKMPANGRHRIWPFGFNRTFASCFMPGRAGLNVIMHITNNPLPGQTKLSRKLCFISKRSNNFDALLQ